jgi:hypothetical protein
LGDPRATRSHFREDASSDPGGETIRHLDEAIFLDLAKALKPAFASIPACRSHKGVDHVDAGFDVVSRVLPGTAA